MNIGARRLDINITTLRIEQISQHYLNKLILKDTMGMFMGNMLVGGHSCLHKCEPVKPEAFLQNLAVRVCVLFSYLYIYIHTCIYIGYIYRYVFTLFFSDSGTKNRIHFLH